MKQFFKSLNYPFVLFFLYLVKSAILPEIGLDAAILGIIGAIFILENIIKYSKISIDNYLETKRLLINENQFRSQVNTDMASLVAEVNSLRLIVNNPLNQLGKRRWVKKI